MPLRLCVTTIIFLQGNCGLCIPVLTNKAGTNLALLVIAV